MRIRLSELVGLRLGDIDKSSRVIFVHRKGNRWQQVPVSRDGFKPLHHYLTTHRAFLAGSEVSHREDAVFLADNGEPLTQWGVSMLFKRLKKRTGTDGTYYVDDDEPLCIAHGASVAEVP